METRSAIYIAGSHTLIGSAIARRLAERGYTNLVHSHEPEPDLLDSRAVESYFARHAPSYVFFAAGKSGGIQANQSHPAELMRDNLLAATNVIHSAHESGATKLLYLASSCSYPRDSAQPMHPDSIMTGRLEPTNEAYATAKLAGMTLCKAYRQEYGADFITAIPADAFGPGDHFTPDDSHVVAALILRMHESKVAGARSVDVWGSGSPRREFIFVDDLADACLFAMDQYEGASPLNLGGGSDLSIRELATHIQEVVGYPGALHFDTSKPDGMPMKRLDASQLIAMGWHPRTPFREGLAATYQYFLQQADREVVHA